MPPGKNVQIARRFQKSIRIDTDLKNSKTLEGFICPNTFSDVLNTMIRHIREKRHGAFTWTGPYGSGKSSLAVAFSALISKEVALRRQAERLFGQQLSKSILRELTTKEKGVRVLPVIGRRGDPVEIIGEALQNEGIIANTRNGVWTEATLLKTLVDLSKSEGLVIIIDELGKLLEAAAKEGRDLHFFQQIAELASRSDGRLLVIGILHQAFEEYAHRLSSQLRDEWAKIQGRYIDLVVDFSGEEQIYLVSQAIESDHKHLSPSPVAKIIASLVRPNRANDRKRLAELLESCWPLHPIVACLLGPISRRRFGQNQRSIFGFLNSSEPHGFQDFLQIGSENEVYEPYRLWDYLRANLEPSILASPDGHRWALAAEVIERCESLGGDELQINLLKSIAIIDLFKERSGLVANFELLRYCFPNHLESAVKNALSQLDGWSLIIFRKFVSAYSIYAGSDFDIEGAVREALVEIDELDFSTLKSIIGLQPILAKRHYHDTGALRWFEVNITSVHKLLDSAKAFDMKRGAIGQFLLAIPTEGEDLADVEVLCREAVDNYEDWDNIVGLSKRSLGIAELAREVLAVDYVRNNNPALAGDSVARKEVALRLVALQAQLETEILQCFDEAQWFYKDSGAKFFVRSELNSFASDLADNRFNKCPRIHNELLNRQKPSGSAIAAQNALLRRMLLQQGQARLGIEGFPAEGGLFSSILESTNLYSYVSNGWAFVRPSEKNDRFRLRPMWDVALGHIKKHARRTVPIAEIYDLWLNQPFGVKQGLLPILVTAFILSEQNSFAIYREGIFRPYFDDVDVDYLSKDPESIQLRWMDLSEMSRKLLSGIADVVRTFDSENVLVHLEPIDVARGLVAIYEKLPLWTKRTMQLSANSMRIREMFQRARDPNRFLFDDLPRSVINNIGEVDEKGLQLVISEVKEGVEELVNAYPTMMSRLREVMLSELQVPNLSRQSITELRDRASNIKQLAGDFRLDAFVGRLCEIDSMQSSFEGIASLAANKPSRDWIDLDLDRATIELADLSQKFLRAETFARVKGRKDKRHSFAVVMGIDDRPHPVIEEFEIADSDRATVVDIIKSFEEVLRQKTNKRNIILAALTELGVRFIEEGKTFSHKSNNV